MSIGHSLVLCYCVHLLNMVEWMVCIWQVIDESPRGQTVMSKRRMKEIKKVWVTQFENKSQKDTNPWWRVNRLVDDFNANKKKMVASSRVKTMDESMSAYRPQKTKTGNLSNISYIQR